MIEKSNKIFICSGLMSAVEKKINTCEKWLESKENLAFEPFLLWRKLLILQ